MLSDDRCKNELCAHAVAVEYLKDFIDQVFEAFQSGTGINFGSPDPITHDIARRLIWHELERTLKDLSDHAEKCHTERITRLRVSAPQASLFAALEQLSPNGDDPAWIVRFVGQRYPEDPKDCAVAYLTTTELYDIKEVTATIKTLEAAGCTVRDWTSGC